MKFFGWLRKRGKKLAQAPKRPGGRAKPLTAAGGSEKKLAAPKAREAESRGKKPEPVVSDEMQQAGEIAERLAKDRNFAEFCMKKKLGDPKLAFFDFYEGIRRNEAVWRAEARAEAKAEEAGKRFSRTVFYGRLFIGCQGKPENITQTLFKG